MTINHAIILASGNGERLGNHIPKQFIKLSGKTIIEQTIEVFENNKNIDQITIVINPNYRFLMEEIILKNNFKKVKRILNGGKTRKDSSFIGLSAISEQDNVLIHDAVRPFVSDRIINECIEALQVFDAVDVAIPSSDTIISINQNNLITDIPDRQKLRRGQTPQAFKVSVIKKAHLLAKGDNFNEVTDDCALILKYKLSNVYVVSGEERNIKITFKEDLYLADRLFQSSTSQLNNTFKLDLLKNKVIVIFGGSKGIGRAIFQMAKDIGAIVYSFSRENGVDVTNYSKVALTLEEIYTKEGRVDYVINTAGVLGMGKISCRNIEDIMDEININYVGAINVVKASFPYLKMSEGSILLFTSSSYTRGRALYSTYSSTKAALVNLVQGLSEELDRDNIKINIMNPERTDTPMRRENFGLESNQTLLHPEAVAELSLCTLLSNLSGQVVDVRK
ncbi:2-C-methyl-D-erythritol 4-phosphate cytidylyltransferase [Priestia aryabhattai]|uniref:2-C-methyl-D-erythritol 4-phosphate cytidylyltransferase n=1 Tax=Priestia aryabhattai TaxID=412384 RepID=UPI001C0B2A41|nr:2-C-methyl-D-erythritol 4-phosphate cytidylyltransferase [Priestia aryabhattai]MBU3570722.1 2-C-methyl-D-erythritol 4-phosphate cytidylyltransferase [Priestia aryabhattai]